MVDAPINHDVFDAFVELVLAPEPRPGDVVMLNNLSSHNSEHARRLIESRGARLVILPPHSPDLNPIRMVFSKIKQLQRSLPYRGKESRWTAMQSVLKKVTASDAANGIRLGGNTLSLA